MWDIRLRRRRSSSAPNTGTPTWLNSSCRSNSIAALFFILIALMFVGLGQVLGRAFDAYPNRVLGYSLNIGGSLVGILAFSALSLAQAPPAVWLLLICVGIGYLLYQDKALSRPRLVALALLTIFTAISADWSGLHEMRWSPYYAVDRQKVTGDIAVNTIGHQAMVPFEAGGSTYSLIHLLERQSGGPPFQDELIIGAGSGNDIAHALHFGVGRVDAVEIDPVIQDIGVLYHPDRPYEDNRVVRHLDDGRHFLRTTDRKYDLVVYAPRRLPDPAQRLRQHSSRKLPLHRKGLRGRPPGSETGRRFRDVQFLPPRMDRPTGRRHGFARFRVRSNRPPLALRRNVEVVGTGRLHHHHRRLQCEDNGRVSAARNVLAECLAARKSRRRRIQRPVGTWRPRGRRTAG